MAQKPLTSINEPRLRALADLVGGDELKIPTEMVIALSTDRPEMLALAKGRFTSPEDVDSLLELIAVFMRTNRALRLHVGMLTKKLEGLRGKIDEMTAPLNDVMKMRMAAVQITREMRSIAAFDYPDEPTEEY